MAKEKQINILLIENSPTDRLLIQELLRNAAHERFHVTNAPTLALGLDSVSRGSVDVIVLDLELPDSEGLDTFRSVRQHAPHLPIVVLTVSADEELARKAVQEGAQRFVIKDMLALDQSHAGLFARIVCHAIEHRRTQAELKASEEDFRALFEQSPVAKIRYDAEGYPTQMNKAALALVGVPDVVAIQHISIFSTPRISDPDKQRLRDGTAVRYEQRYDFDEIRKGGHFATTRSGTRYLDAHVTPLYSEDGAVKEYIGQFVDITERKRAEDELENIAKFPEENPNPILRLTPKGRILYANAASEMLVHGWGSARDPCDQVRSRAAEAYRTDKISTLDATLGTQTFQLTFIPLTDKGYVNVYGTNITARKHAEESLKRIEWMLTQRFTPTSLDAQRRPYGDLTALNRSGVLLDAVGAEWLASLASEYLELLDSSSAIYERNGAYALGIFSSGWCQFLDAASRELCDTSDNSAALTSGQWHCHESCWSDASKRAIETGEPVDVPCRGGIRLHAVPVRAGSEIIGAMNFGYGDPPQDEATLREIAKRYAVPISELRRLAAAYGSRPPYIIELAKKRLQTAATLIGSLVEQKQAKDALREAHEQVKTLNEELRSANEELHTANETLERRVQERTDMLASLNEQLQAANEELSTSNKELLQEIRYRVSAEQEARAYAGHIKSLNDVITAGNQAETLQAAMQAMLGAAVDLLGFDGGLLYLLTHSSDVAELRASRHASAEMVKLGGRVPITLPNLAPVYRGESWFTDAYPDEGTAEYRRFMEGVSATAVVPLIAGNNIVGHYGVWSARPHSFSPEDQALLEAIGREAGTVIARMQAEEQRRSSARYARSLIEASLDPLLTISAKGKITDVNGATEMATGFSREDLIGNEFSDYFTDPAAAKAGYQQVFTYGYVKDYPLAIRHKSGSIREVLYNATVFKNDSGEVQGVFAAARDITDQKRAQNALDAAHEEVRSLYEQLQSTNEELVRHSQHLEELIAERTSQLRNAERLAGIGETAAMIGHDLRNPLQGLQYIVDLQKLRLERIPPEKRGAEDWKQEQALFDRISEQIFYMDKIVADLQDYARPLTPQTERVAVSTVINDVLVSLPHTDHIKIVSDVSDLAVVADPHLMHRVFANLILNAIQAMPEGGTLTISASRFDDSVSIKVHDTGVGIPAQMEDKLFKPLFTGKAKGTGLGLAVVKRVVDAHGGTITFESGEGNGTTFTVTLPSRSE